MKFSLCFIVSVPFTCIGLFYCFSCKSALCGRKGHHFYFGLKSAAGKYASVYIESEEQMIKWTGVANTKISEINDWESIQNTEAQLKLKLT